MINIGREQKHGEGRGEGGRKENGLMRRFTFADCPCTRSIRVECKMTRTCHP